LPCKLNVVFNQQKRGGGKIEVGRLKKPGEAIAVAEQANDRTEVFCIPLDLKALQNAIRASAGPHSPCLSVCTCEQYAERSR